MTVHVFASLQPKPDHREKVALALKSLVSATRAEPGNITYDLFIAGEGDRGFYLIESYTDVAAFEAHKASRHYLDYREKVAEWLLALPSVKVLYPLDAIGSQPT
ncbi:putative quinol monooxygenase [Dechloromonas sp. ZY10]|uniref:putative quinol monooxygenase n=1 Tax=Dechloromonas aquae TaxID=2664436 RepID=UPI003528E686